MGLSRGTSEQKAEVAPPTTLFLFGAHGDLVKRLLMPALHNLARDGLVDSGLHIVGVDHNAISDADFAKKLENFIRDESAAKVSESGKDPLDPELWGKLAERISYVQGDFLDDSTYRDIESKIKSTGSANAVFYLATAPRFFSEVAARLGSSGLLKETEGGFRRVVIEKPFGSDLASAVELNNCLLKVMSEKQIYRIDHYLGKETVQNFWSAVSPTGCSSRSGTTITLTMCRSPLRKQLALKPVAASTRTPVPCATWCPIICFSCWRWLPWSHRLPLVPMPCAAKRPRW